MARKKKPPVNIDNRVNKYIRDEGIKRGKKLEPDYSDRKIREYIKEKSKGRVKVVSDERFKRMTDEQKEKHTSMKEASRQYRNYRHDWFYRYQPVEGTEYKKKIPGTKFDKETGGKVYTERTRTFIRWRDTLTGRFVSYGNERVVRDKETKKLKWVPVEQPKGKSVRELREEMRKEATIYKMAERKRISVQDARELYDDFEERGMARYLMKEYAETP